jgi:hypothetical protein
VPLHVVEKCLNHTSGTFGGIVAVYQRHDFLDEQRQAVGTWEQFVISLTRARRKYRVGVQHQPVAKAGARLELAEPSDSTAPGF